MIKMLMMMMVIMMMIMMMMMIIIIIIIIIKIMKMILMMIMIMKMMIIIPLGTDGKLVQREQGVPGEVQGPAGEEGQRPARGEQGAHQHHEGEG